MARIKLSDTIYTIIVLLLGILLLIWAIIAYFALLLNLLNVTSLFVNFSTIILLMFLIILIIRYFLLLWASYRQHRESLVIDSQLTEDFTPTVSILVPAHNEGQGIEAAIQSLLEIHYPQLEIVVINDGSTDDTLTRAVKWAGTYRNATVKVVDTKENIGKAEALNLGIKNSSGEIVVCMDGDSRLESDSIIRGVVHFKDPKVAAVAGNVKIINRINLITKLQALEYIEGLNLVRRAQGYYQCVNIIPGPMGFFRRTALEEVGGYESDTYAEDCDLTVKMLSYGMEINYEPGAVSWTEAPESIVGLITQRYRWTRGILQAVRKHQHSLLHFRKSGFINSIVLWYMIFESVIWPFLNIFGNIFFLFVAFWYGAINLLILWWMILTLLDTIAALHTVSMEEEELELVLYAIPYRLFFILAIDVAKLLSTFEEILGIRMSWGRIERKGRTARTEKP
jgi:poly-beta-1,6 N-acetyl-D-glucosamine synthase